MRAPCPLIVCHLCCVAVREETPRRDLRRVFADGCERSECRSAGLRDGSEAVSRPTLVWEACTDLGHRFAASAAAEGTETAVLDVDNIRDRGHLSRGTSIENPLGAMLGEVGRLPTGVGILENPGPGECGRAGGDLGAAQLREELARIPRVEVLEPRDVMLTCEHACPGCGSRLLRNGGQSPYPLCCDGVSHEGSRDIRDCADRFSCLACGRSDCSF